MDKASTRTVNLIIPSAGFYGARMALRCSHSTAATWAGRDTVQGLVPGKSVGFGHLKTCEVLLLFFFSPLENLSQICKEFSSSPTCLCPIAGERNCMEIPALGSCPCQSSWDESGDPEPRVLPREH